MIVRRKHSTRFLFAPLIALISLPVLAQDSVILGSEISYNHGQYPAGPRPPYKNTHIGVDLAAPCGTPIRPIAEGYIVGLVSDIAKVIVDSDGKWWTGVTGISSKNRT